MRTSRFDGRESTGESLTNGSNRANFESRASVLTTLLKKHEAEDIDARRLLHTRRMLARVRALFEGGIS